MLTHEKKKCNRFSGASVLEHELNVRSEKHLSLLEPLTDHYNCDKLGTAKRWSL